MNVNVDVNDPVIRRFAERQERIKAQQQQQIIQLMKKDEENYLLKKNELEKKWQSMEDQIKQDSILANSTREEAEKQLAAMIEEREKQLLNISAELQKQYDDKEAEIITKKSDTEKNLAELSNLKTETSSFQSEKQTKTKELEKVRGRHKVLEMADKEAAEKHSQAVKSLRDQYQAEIISAQSALAEATDKNDFLGNKKATTTTRFNLQISKLERSLSILNEEMGEQSQRNGNMDAKLEATKIDAETRFNDAKQRLSSFEIRLVKLENDINEEDDRHGKKKLQLENDVELAREQTRAMKKELLSMQRQINLMNEQRSEKEESIQRQMKVVANQLKEIQENINQTSAKNQELEGTVNNLQLQITQERHRAEEIGSKGGAASGGVDVDNILPTNTGGLPNDSVTEKKLNQLQKDIKEQEEKNTSLQKELAQKLQILDIEHQTDIDDIAHLKSELEELEEKTDKIRKTHTTSQNQMMNKEVSRKQKIDEMNEQLRGLMLRNAEIENTSLSSTEEREKFLNEETGKLKKVEESENKELQGKQRELQEKKERLTDLESRYKSLQEKSKSFAADKESLLKNNNALVKQMQDLMREQAQLADRFAALERQVQDHKSGGRFFK